MRRINEVKYETHTCTYITIPTGEGLLVVPEPTHYEELQFEEDILNRINLN